MAVYYRYKSGVQTFSVPVAAPCVTVADLKSLILRTARHGHGRTRGRGPRETVALYDERTCEEYTDGTALVPRGSTVLVRQVAGPPAEAITVASSPPPPHEATATTSDPAATSSSTAEDDEAKAISAVIDAAELKWDSSSQGWRRYKVMSDAVVASRCCFGSLCDVCIRGQIAAKSRCACGAQSRSDDLIPNLTLRATIAKLVATSAAGSGSAGTSNRKSSAGSNAEPTSQSAAAASQESRSRVTATAGSGHSEGSASSTSKCATPPAARETRVKRTTVESAEAGAHAAGYPAQYGYMNPFGSGCYDPFFGAPAWPCDPYMYYGNGMPYGGGYANVPVPAAGYHDVPCHGWKRMADGEFQRHAEDGFKRRCGGRSEVAL